MLEGTQTAWAYKTWQDKNPDGIPSVDIQLGLQEQGCGHGLSLDLLLHSGNFGGGLHLLSGLWSWSSTLDRSKSSAQCSGRQDISGRPPFSESVAKSGQTSLVIGICYMNCPVLEKYKCHLLQ